MSNKCKVFFDALYHYQELESKVDSTKILETINYKNIFVSKKLKMKKKISSDCFILMFMLNESGDRMIFITIIC